MRNLKTIILILTASTFTLCSMQSCKKVKDAVDKLITFGYSAGGEFEMPANIPVNFPFTTPALPLDYNLEEELAKNNTSSDLVREIKLEYIKLSIVLPDTHDFSFLKDIEVKLKKDGVGEKTIAWKYNVSDAVGQVLELEVTPDKLDDYLKSDDFQMLVSTTLDEVVSQPVKIKYELRVTVKANVFK